MKRNLYATGFCAAYCFLLPVRGDVLVEFDFASVDVGGALEAASPGTYNLPFEAVDWSDHVQSPTGLQLKGVARRSDSSSASINNWGTALNPSNHASFKVSALPGHKLNLTSFSFSTFLGQFSYDTATSFVWAYRIDADNDGSFEQDWVYGTVYSEATHGATVFDREGRLLDWPLTGVSTSGTIEFGLFATAPSTTGNVYPFSRSGNLGVSLNGGVTKTDGSPPDPLPPLPSGILGRYQHVEDHYLDDGEDPGYSYDQVEGKIGAPEASGVAYNRDTDTLFMVGDEGYAVAEFDKQGQFVGSMLLDYKARPRENRAMDDPEGITYLGNNTFGISDERDNMLRITSYDPAAIRTLADLTPTSYAFGSIDLNSGAEGVSYDPINKSIWGIKETGLTRIYEMQGVPGVSASGTAFSVSQPIARKWLTRAGITPDSSVPQLSEIFVLAASDYLPAGHPSYHNLLLLGREANKIVEITREGRLVSSLDISAIGRHTVEGMTMDDEGVIYLVSEGSLRAEDPPEVKNSGLHIFTPTVASNYTLQLLHLADEEAGLLASQTAPHLAALVDAFDGTHPNTLILSGGDSFIPSPFLSGGTDPSLNTIAGIGSTAFARPDYAILNALGVEASAIGNHEWDLGTAVFADAIRPVSPWPGAQFPHITANLDFSGDSAISGANAISVNVPVDGTTTAVPETSGLKGKIVPTAVITKGGEKIGLVGVTTQLIESISSPSGTKVKGNPGGDDMDLLATQVQPFIDELAAEGVNKIILLSHLQQITNEQSLATKLQGVDIILAAGSNTRLGDSDDVAVAFPGHAADFAGTYPLRTAGTDGKPTLIVNTDNEFTYLGRLVVDFTPAGEVILESLDSRIAEIGAYASTAENVATAWNTTVDNLPATAFAAGTKGAQVKAITDAVQGVINAKDGTVHGYTTVYLEGERSQVRSEETNLGDITADANANALRAITGSTGPIVSLKNGGGIRAQIGAVSSASGSSEKLPPPANPSVGKLEGGISQLDIENALRFDNKLIAFETTPVGLKAILEHGIGAWPNQGRFPQVGGVSFAWNPNLPVGSRVQTISLIDKDGAAEAAIYANGVFVENAPSSITMVTLNFLANDGDGYPMKANGSNFRYLLADGTLGPVLDEAVNFTVSPSLPGNPVGEQQVFAEYLNSRYPTTSSAYSIADTDAASDLRVQTLSARANDVLPYTPNELWTLNNYADALRALGISPSVALTSPSLIAAIGNTHDEGKEEVINNPASFGFYTEDSIQDLRGTGVLIQVQGEVVNLRLPVERSTTLDTDSWEDTGYDLEATLPKIGDKAFYRLSLPE